MIDRFVRAKIESALKRQSAVALVGPRQVGKTTLARSLVADGSSLYLDLESPVDRAKISSPVSFLNMYRDKLVVLDEIHRVPELFDVLRGLIDEGRREGNDLGRFLILGSASMDLMKQSETLAGRIAYVDMPPLSLVDPLKQEDQRRLWLRGGYPNSLLAADDEASFDNRLDFIRSYLERDVPMFAPRMPAQTVGTLWRMLAHSQGTTLNAAKLAASLQVSAPSLKSYLGLLTDLLLVRQLPPLARNVKKRLVKSPKIYVRDSGFVHALLGIETTEDLMGHPVVGTSWEGFVIENILNAAPRRTEASFYRTQSGAEIDLVLDMGARHGVWAIEIKLSEAPTLTKGNRLAFEDLGVDRRILVYPGDEAYPMDFGVEVVGIKALVEELKALSNRRL